MSSGAGDKKNAKGKKPRLSLLLKFTALSLAAAAATISVFWTSGDILFDDAREQHAQRIGNLTRFVVNAVLSDPSPQRLGQISDELGINIRYADANTRIVTDDAMPNFSEVRRFRRRGGDGRPGRFGHHARRGRFGAAFPRELSLARAEDDIFLLYDDGNRRALISLDDNDFLHLLPLVAPLALAALLLIWGGVYFALRRELLTPLAALRRDIEKVGNGDWREHTPRRNDELGQLALGFNAMQARLRALLEARERFLIAASHELRSPIARLKLAVAMLNDSPDDNRKKIEADLRELESLTADILQNARLQSDHAGLTQTMQDAAQWLGEVASSRSPDEQARLTVSAPAEHSVYIDKPLMTRAVQNLLDNAFKHAGGKVDLRLTQAPAAAGGADGDTNITVSDNGAGVPPESLPLLFEPFYRADKSRARATGGFGLGLALVAATAKAHGGATRAQNKTPTGLTVTITIPAAPNRNG